MPSITKTALITGASSGFGREFVKLFAQDGYNVILVARHEEDLRTVAFMSNFVPDSSSCRYVQNDGRQILSFCDK